MESNQLIGQMLGKYRIDAKLGEGGMGVVYRATDITLDRVVALKMLQKEITVDPKIKERLKIEAKALARFNHPNIAILYEFDVVNNFFAMEYIEGQTVEELCKQEGVLPPERIRSILKQVLPALGVAHKSGIIHRDIKPANLMLTPSGLVKITDFGIAKMPAGVSGVKTMSGERIVGSYYYISPEQIQHMPVDGRTDIYSLGVTLFEMATGKVPFDSDSDFLMMKAHVEDPPPLPSSLNPHLDPRFEKVILKALEKDPKNRYQSAEEMLVALDAAVLSPKPVPNPPGKLAEERKSASRRRRWLVPVGLLFVVGLIAAAVMVFSKGKNNGTPEFFGGAEPSAQITLSDVPAGGQVFLDDEKVLVTPDQPLELAPGTHRLRVEKSGALPWNRKFEVEPGQRLAFSVALAVNQGFLRVVTNPPEAELSLDDLPIKNVAEALPVTVGAHRLKAQAPGFRDTIAEFTVESGETKSVALTLNSRGEFLRITNLPPEAYVWVNGQEVRNAGEPLRVPFGENRIHVRVPEREDWSRLVMVPAGKMVSVEYQPPKGMLTLSARPYATFYVDGQKIGESGVKTQLEVEAGTHQVRLVYLDGSFDTTVVVSSKTPTEVNHTFRVRR